MDHDKRDEVPKSAGPRSQIVVAPADKGTTPSSTPMAGLRFGSFGAASAPSRLWGDRAEADDPEEHVLPLISPTMSPARGGTPGHVASALSPPALQGRADVQTQEMSPAVSPVCRSPSTLGRVAITYTPMGEAGPRQEASARPRQSPQRRLSFPQTEEVVGSPRQAALHSPPLPQLATPVRAPTTTGGERGQAEAIFTHVEGRFALVASPRQAASPHSPTRRTAMSPATPARPAGH